MQKERKDCQETVQWCSRVLVPPQGIYITMWCVSLGSTSVMVVQSSCCVDSLWPHELQSPGLPVPHHLLEFAQVHVHYISDSSNHLILCHPPLPLPSISPSLHLFQWADSAWVGQSIGASASVLPGNTQHWSPLGWTGLISLQSKGLSRVFSGTTVWKHQFFGALPSSWSSSHNCTWLLERP